MTGTISERRTLRPAMVAMRTVLSCVLTAVLVAVPTSGGKAEALDAASHSSEGVALTRAKSLPLQVPGAFVAPLAASATYEMYVYFDANGGTISDSPHQGSYQGSTVYYKLSDGVVQRSSSKNGTYVRHTNRMITAQSKALNETGNMGIKKAGYHTVDSKMYVSSKTGKTIDCENATVKDVYGTLSSNLGESKAVKLKVNWIANTYTVKYNGNGSNGGSTAASAHTYDTAKNLTSNGFTRTYKVTYNANGGACSTASATAAYTFSGWNTKADGTGTKYGDKASVKNLTTTNGGTVNLYATWTSKSVTLPTPTRTGYTFKGWSTSATATSGTAAGKTYAPTANVTLYATWAANTYTVKYNANGGSGTMSSSSHTYDTAKALTANGFTREGYNFVGWNTKADGTGTKYANKASVKNLTATNGGTVTLYAQWNAAKMTVKYHVNGGTIATNTSNATRYRASSSIVQRSTDSGSTWTNYTSAIASTDAYKDLVNVGTPPITKTGYHVTGTAAWNTKADGTGVTVSQQNTSTDAANAATTKRINGGTQISANKTVTLYANWAANTYSVKYNANGGSGTMSSSSHTYDAAKALTANVFTREGYNFAGWNTKADGTGTKYANKASVKNLTATNGGTVTLYAQWSEEEVPQLEFTVTSEICFVEKADGTLIGPDNGAVYLENKSSAPIRVSGLAVDEGNARLCSGEPESGAATICMTPEGGEPVSLADYVGGEYTALPDLGQWTIAAGARLNLESLTGKACDLPGDLIKKTYVGSIGWLVEFAE